MVVGLVLGKVVEAAGSERQYFEKNEARNRLALVVVDLVVSTTASTMQTTSKPMVTAISATANHLELKHELGFEFLQGG